jgi:alpha-tubulin suppressor-like RCC1 family protein
MPVRTLPRLLLAALLLAACDLPSKPDGPGAPAKLDIVSGDLQQDTVGDELPQALVVRVTDDRGRPVPDQVVNFRVTAGNGSVFAGTATTNRDGEARERWTLGTVAGDTQRVEARAVDSGTGQALVFAAFRAVGTPDAPATATIVGAATRAGSAGAAVADSLVVKVVDQYGNAVPGVGVTFTAANGGSVSPATATTRADGTARAQWMLGPVAGPQSASATVAGFPALVFAGTAAAGAVTRVVLTPESVRFNALGQTAALTVAAFDAFGNPVGGQQVMIVSQNGAVAALDAGAVVRAVGNGTTRLIATVQGSTAADTTVVTVQQVATEVRVAPTSATLLVGETVQLQPSAVDARGNAVAGAVFQYASSGPSVTVSSTGLVRAVAGGTDSVRVYTDSAQAWAVVAVRAELRAAQVSAGYDHACAVQAGGAAFCWGWNTLGQIGTGSSGGPDACPPATTGGGCHAYAVPVAGGHVFRQVSAGGRFTCGVTSAGAALCWGRNDLGQLGVGDTGHRSAPTAVSGGRTFASVSSGGSHACALTAAGEAFCWGQGTSGELGDGNNASSLVPVRVAGGLTFTSISAGYGHTCAVTAAGAAYCWGSNAGGRLGTGRYGNESQPAEVTGRYSFASISAGGQATCATTPGGTAYCWGVNFDGGLATVALGSSPEPIPAPVKGGITFRYVNAGGFENGNSGSYCGVSTSSTIHCWGATRETRTTTGQLRSPELVAGSSGFTGVEVGGTFKCGIDADDRVRCWGNGVFGDGTLAAPTYQHELRVVRIR